MKQPQLNSFSQPAAQDRIPARFCAMTYFSSPSLFLYILIFVYSKHVLGGFSSLMPNSIQDISSNSVGIIAILQI